MNEIEGLPLEKLKQVIDFACFIKTRDTIDPSLSYFWTKKWQDMGNEADKDKETGDMIGSGSLSSLFR